MAVALVEAVFEVAGGDFSTAERIDVAGQGDAGFGRVGEGPVVTIGRTSLKTATSLSFELAT